MSNKLTITDLNGSVTEIELENLDEKIESIVAYRLRQRTRELNAAERRVAELEAENERLSRENVALKLTAKPWIKLADELPPKNGWYPVYVPSPIGGEILEDAYYEYGKWQYEGESVYPSHWAYPMSPPFIYRPADLS